MQFDCALYECLHAICTIIKLNILFLVTDCTTKLHIWECSFSCAPWASSTFQFSNSYRMVFQQWQAAKVCSCNLCVLLTQCFIPFHMARVDQGFKAVLKLFLTGIFIGVSHNGIISERELLSWLLHVKWAFSGYYLCEQQWLPTFRPAALAFFGRKVKN